MPSSPGLVFPSIPVLVVDDHPTSRRVLGDTLEQLGLRPQVVHNSETAWTLMHYAAAANAPFRLAVIDAEMPDQDGLSFARQIRENANFADCPIVLLVPAGHANAERNADELLPNTWYFTKPAKVSELTEAIREALGLHSAVEPEPVKEISCDAQPMRILLVDDAPVNREVATGLLEMSGYYIETANNGRDAIDLLEQHEFDVVLMDLEMPEMDGLSATRVIRDRERLTFNRIPIIAMTAHAIDEVRDQCVAAGMDGYLTKPVQPLELFGALEAVRSGLPVSAYFEPQRRELTIPTIYSDLTTKSPQSPQTNIY